MPQNLSCTYSFTPFDGVALRTIALTSLERKEQFMPNSLHPCPAAKSHVLRATSA